MRRIASTVIRRSDLIVLDWHLHGDDGEATVELLEDVVRDADGAMRLVAIYTGEPDRSRVARKLVQRLGAIPLDDVRVDIGPLRIVVIGKGDADDDSSSPEAVPEEHLPARLVAHFCDLADGLVRTAALSALAALRGATYRLLTELGPEIDLGYVGQRASVFPSAEAEDHLFAMLVAGLRAVVEDDMATRACTDSHAVALWLARESAQGRGAKLPPDLLS